MTAGVVLFLALTPGPLYAAWGLGFTITALVAVRRRVRRASDEGRA